MLLLNSAYKNCCIFLKKVWNLVHFLFLSFFCILLTQRSGSLLWCPLISFLLFPFSHCFLYISVLIYNVLIICLYTSCLEYFSYLSVDSLLPVSAILNESYTLIQFLLSSVSLILHTCLNHYYLLTTYKKNKFY